MDDQDRDLGIQPLDSILNQWQLDNHHLVATSPEQLTHKQVARARSGRRLTLKMKMKVARALNFAIWGRLTNEERETYQEYFPKHLFSYHKDYTDTEPDENAPLYNVIGGRKVRRDFLAELGLEN